MDMATAYEDELVAQLVGAKKGQVVDIPKEISFKDYINMDISGFTKEDLYMKVTIVDAAFIELDMNEITDDAIRKEYQGVRSREDFERAYAEQNMESIAAAYNQFIQALQVAFTTSLQQAYNIRIPLKAIKMHTMRALGTQISQGEEAVQGFINYFKIPTTAKRMITQLQEGDQSLLE